MFLHKTIDKFGPFLLLLSFSLHFVNFGSVSFHTSLYFVYISISFDRSCVIAVIVSGPFVYYMGVVRVNQSMEL